MASDAGPAHYGALLEGAFVSVEFADCPHELAPMAIFRRTLGRLRVASLEPRPDAFIVTVGETLGQIVRLLVQTGEKSTDRLLVTLVHGTNDGLQHVNKQAWPCVSNS